MNPFEMKQRRRPAHPRPHGDRPETDEDAITLLAEPVDAPRLPLVGAIAGALTGLFAVVGALALLLVLGGALLWSAFTAGDPSLNQAVDRLTAAARALPQVRSATATPGLGDLESEPTDVYGDVHLIDACTMDSLAAATTRLRAIMAQETTFHWHPTVWCRGRGLTVSTDAEVTRQRLDLVRRLDADRSLRAAAAITTQRGDDASPDLDDTALQVDLWVRPRTSGTVARDWLERLQAAFPAVTVTATTGGPGAYLDPLALQDGQWTVVVQAGDPDSAAILATASKIEASPTVTAVYCDGPGRQVAVFTSAWSALPGLQRTLPTPRTGEQPLNLSVSLQPGR